MIGLDKLKYRLRSVNIGWDRLKSVRIDKYQLRLFDIGLNWLILV